MFGPDMLVAPITSPANASRANEANYPWQSLAFKSTWLPPGNWYDSVSGVITVSPPNTGVTITKGYTLGQIPTWIKGGAVIPYIPLESFPTLVGLARAQYTFLGFKIVPGGSANTGAVAVYEDDGTTTAYLTDNAYVYTTAAYAFAADGSSVSVTITSTGKSFGRDKVYSYVFISHHRFNG